MMSAPPGLAVTLRLSTTGARTRATLTPRQQCTGRRGPTRSWPGAAAGRAGGPGPSCRAAQYRKHFTHLITAPASCDSTAPQRALHTRPRRTLGTPPAPSPSLPPLHLRGIVCRTGTRAPGNPDPCASSGTGVPGPRQQPRAAKPHPTPLLHLPPAQCARRREKDLRCREETPAIIRILYRRTRSLKCCSRALLPFRFRSSPFCCPPRALHTSHNARTRQTCEGCRSARGRMSAFVARTFVCFGAPRSRALPRCLFRTCFPRRRALSFSHPPPLSSLCNPGPLTQLCQYACVRCTQPCIAANHNLVSGPAPRS